MYDTEILRFWPRSMNNKFQFRYFLFIAGKAFFKKKFFNDFDDSLLTS